MNSSVPHSKTGIVSLAVIVGFLWLVMILYARATPFNYDEVAEAHATWQVSQGFKPYQDFHYDHPPFFWFACAPILRRLPQNFKSLVVLRIVNISFAAAAFALLAWLAIRKESDTALQLAAIAAVASTAVQFPVLQTFMEFRADALCWLFALIALAVLDSETSSRHLRWAVSGFLFSIAAMFSLKIVALAGAAVLVGVVSERRQERRALWKNLLIFAAAGLAGGALGVLFCAARGVDVWLMYEFVIEFHRSFLHAYGLHFGLAAALMELCRSNPVLILVFCLGAFGIIQEIISGRWRNEKAAAALCLFCLLQPLWVRYPWRQYVAGFLFAWSVPLWLSFRFFFDRLPIRMKWVLPAITVIAGLWGETGRLREALRTQYLDKNIRLGDTLLEWSRPGDFVAAQPPFHPVFRRNSTFFFTYPVNPGGDTEQLLSRLPGFEKTFSREGYLQQLRDNPPALILVDPDYSGRNYQQAIDEYLRGHSDDYELRHIGPVPVRVLKRAAH